MFTEDNLATAQLAQIFGSELLRVDQNTTQQASMSGPATKINPKQFLAPTQQPGQRPLTAAERRMVEAVNREAEMAYPRNDTPPPQQFVPPPQPVQAAPVAPQQTIQPISATVSKEQSDQLTFADFFGTGANVEASKVLRTLENIDRSLERIARAIESVDLSSKKKKVNGAE